MRWLSRFSASVFDRIRNESGAVIVFVAVAMVALLAMTAFVIDFGRIWQERRELQGGATAGVLAVAEDCARDLCDLAYNELATAELYADANAIDGAASVFSMDLDLTDQTVRVVTATENSAGGNTMDMLFAGIVGFDTVTVGADAAAAWGTPLGATTIPLIISDCEWRKDDPGWPGASPGGLPEYPKESSSLVSGNMVTITFHDPLGPEECDALPGHDADMDGKLPAGFGWLDANSDCETEVTEGSLVSNDPGSSPSNGCNVGEIEDLLGEVVLIPYFSDIDGITGKGTNGEYVIEAHGAFLVAGYNFGGPYREYDPLLMTGVPCSGPVRCIAGWFVKTVSNGGAPGDLGGKDRGDTVIKLIG